MAEGYCNNKSSSQLFGRQGRRGGGGGERDAKSPSYFTDIQPFVRQGRRGGGGGGGMPGLTSCFTDHFRFTLILLLRPFLNVLGCFSSGIFSFHVAVIFPADKQRFSSLCDVYTAASQSVPRGGFLLPHWDPSLRDGRYVLTSSPPIAPMPEFPF